MIKHHKVDDKFMAKIFDIELKRKNTEQAKRYIIMNGRENLREYIQKEPFVHRILNDALDEEKSIEDILFDMLEGALKLANELYELRLHATNPGHVIVEKEG